MDTPKAQEIYRHFKGNLYRIIAVAEHSETGEKFVIYHTLEGEGKTYARPLDMFMSPVDKHKYPDVTQKMRFEKVEDDADKESKTEEEVNLDPAVDDFIMTDSYTKRLEILNSIEHRITEDMLVTMAVVCDISLIEGTLQEKYDNFKKSLQIRQKFEV